MLSIALKRWYFEEWNQNNFYQINICTKIHLHEHNNLISHYIIIKLKQEEKPLKPKETKTLHYELIRCLGITLSF